MNLITKEIKLEYNKKNLNRSRNTVGLNLMKITLAEYVLVLKKNKILFLNFVPV